MEISKPTHKTSDYRVVIGNETTEYEARLVARDSELDLVWFRITGANGRTFPFLDLTNPTELQIGDTYYTILRLPERFDRGPFVQSGVVGGGVNVPRTMLVANGDAGPVFAENGKLAGFFIQQTDKDGDGGGAPTARMAIRFILPTAELAKATEQVNKQPSE